MRTIIIATTALLIGALPALADSFQHQREQKHNGISQAFQDNGPRSEHPDYARLHQKITESKEKFRHNAFGH